MATDTKRCTLKWEIKNFSNLWWMKKGERLESPIFVGDAWAETKWTLWLYPMGVDYEGSFNPFLPRDMWRSPMGVGYENSFGLFLHREIDSEPNIMEKVHVDFKLLGKDFNFKLYSEVSSSFSKNSTFGSNSFELRRDYFTERNTIQTFLFEDTLTIECTIGTNEQSELAPEVLFATTVVKTKRRYFLWRIDRISSLESGIRNCLKDNLIAFNLSLNAGLDSLYVELTSFNDTIKYISCNTSITDSSGEKKNCGNKRYFSSDLEKGDLSSEFLLPQMLLENRGQYLPNDALSLCFEFVLATIKHLDEVEKEQKPQNTAVLSADFKSLYNDGTLCDMELRTSSKTFQVHKVILSARSPVFRSMFTSDMKEINSGYVDINDLDAVTVHQMLLYIYTDNQGDLQFDSASKLYEAADKYQILSLKSICASFLKKELNLENAYEALVLSDLHSDEDLKSYIQDYLLGLPEQAYYSQEWKDFMSAHLELAGDLMYRKITHGRGR